MCIYVYIYICLRLCVNVCVSDLSYITHVELNRKYLSSQYHYRTLLVIDNKVVKLLFVICWYY